MQEQVKILNNLPDGAIIVEQSLDDTKDEKPTSKDKRIKFLNISLVKMFKDHISMQEEYVQNRSSHTTSAVWLHNQ